VCVRQRNEEGAREVVHMGCRHEAEDKKKVRVGKKGSGLMNAQRGQSHCSDKGSVAGPVWLSGESILSLL
jgi:hypothetical protein